MATITLRTSMSGPVDNEGSCRVLYEVTGSEGIDKEVFVVMRRPPAYKGASEPPIWQHVAYVDEMTNLPVTPNPKESILYRTATALVDYTSLEKAQAGINSIRAQIQRLVNAVNILATYTETNTWIISSTN